MSFGMFEANVTSEDENKRQVREAANKLTAATYDVRERFGSFLFASRDLAEYNDRLALSKTDILKTIEPHVFPRTGTVRRVLKPLEREFRSIRRLAAPDSPFMDEDGTIQGPGARYDYENSPPGLFSGPELKIPESTAEFMNTNGGIEDSLMAGTELGAGVSPDGESLFGDAAGGAAGNNGSAPTSLFGPAADGTAAGSNAAPGNAAPGGAAPGGVDAAGGNAGGDAGGSDWSPNGNTDSIGAGDYEIQAGDTLTSISDRSGVSVDDLASGNSIADPDMIYAGDSLSIPGGTDSTATAPDAATTAPDASSTAAPDAAPLAAESGYQAPTSNPPTTNPGSMTDPGLTSPGQEMMTNPGMASTARRRAAQRRRADFERNLDTDVTFHPSDDELKPEGDFKGYLKSVDQGAEGKADHNFGGTFPGGTDHDMDPAKTDFVKGATRRFASWCQHRQVRPTLAALDDYSPSDREYIAIAADLQRLAKPIGPEWDSRGKPKAVKPTKPAPLELHESPEPEAHWAEPGKQARRHYATLCRQRGVRPTEKGFRRWAGEHSLETGHNSSSGYNWMDKNKVNPYTGIGGEEPNYPHSYDDDRERGPYWPEPGGKHRAEARRRTAAPDYLQKADEALTNLLNQKAEEFQTQIAPLQQALQTVQQAEQEAQAANPLNVMPPAGTVNVLPGQDPAAGGAPGGAAGGADPLAALMGGGGDPSMGGGDPSMGGGMPPGMDPSMMGGDPSQQQMVARRGKARGGASPRTAENVEDLWSKFTQESTMRGGEPDVETFAQKYRVGPKALKRIRQKALGG